MSKLEIKGLIIFFFKRKWDKENKAHHFYNIQKIMERRGEHIMIKCNKYNETTTSRRINQISLQFLLNNDYRNISHI